MAQKNKHKRHAQIMHKGISLEEKKSILYTSSAAQQSNISKYTYAHHENQGRSSIDIVVTLIFILTVNNFTRTTESLLCAFSAQHSIFKATRDLMWTGKSSKRK
jgi:hypothetical protein